MAVVCEAITLVSLQWRDGARWVLKYETGIVNSCGGGGGGAYSFVACLKSFDR